MSRNMDDFIQSLTEKTEDNLVQWKRERRDTFTFSTERASVTISQTNDFENIIRTTKLCITNDNGDLVDTEQVTVASENPEIEDIELLYNRARGSAYNASNVLSSILDDIDNATENEN